MIEQKMKLSAAARIAYLEDEFTESVGQIASDFFWERRDKEYDIFFSLCRDGTFVAELLKRTN